MSQAGTEPVSKIDAVLFTPARQAYTKKQYVFSGEEDSVAFPVNSILFVAIPWGQTFKITGHSEPDNPEFSINVSGLVINPHDPAQALDIYLAEAKKGDVDAMERVASLYLDLKDFVSAAEWHKKAAELGRISAMIAFAYDNYFGRGVEESHTTAIEWFERVAEINSPDTTNPSSNMAKCTLGAIYLHENPAKIDYDKIEKMWDIPPHQLSSLVEAAEKGDATSQLKLAKLYNNLSCSSRIFQGFFIYVLDEIKKWTTAAAEQGNAEAQYFLGQFYESRDYKEAYFWLSLAKRGGQKIDDNLDFARRRLSAEQMREIDKRVEEWTPANAR